MPWLQLRIQTSPEEASAIEHAVSAAQALAVTLEDNADQPIFEPAIGETPLWKETRVTALFPADIDTNAKLEEIQQALGVALAQTHWHILEDKDWEREWMQNFRPLRCADNLWICPSWMEPPAPDAINLRLDPGLAFGTGTHPTTFLCLQWLAKQKLKGARVIDYGCGSGILGVAALLLGAKHATGIDIDPQALLATQENTLRNGLDKERFPVFYPGKQNQEKVELVLANILAGPLVELADELCTLLLPGAKLCLSGVLASQYPAIEAAYEKHIQIDAVDNKEEWICVSGTKK